jgi:crossover junction endodeoxyribonuclease RuvC
MRILGVDPGLVCTGVGVIEIGARLPATEFSLLTCVLLKPPRAELSQRLLFLHQNLLTIIRETGAEVMAVEDQFYGSNAQTAFKTGQARGAALLSAAEGNIPVNLYAPASVKLAVVGNGQASKEQVRHMVQQILKTTSLPAALDASDALAVALCHAFSLGRTAIPRQFSKSRRR